MGGKFYNDVWVNGGREMAHEIMKKSEKDILKGKCALGPFLSILVIECEHKWSCVNLCQMMDKVKNNIKVCF
jgi:hypothetical protein